MKNYKTDFVEVDQNWATTSKFQWSQCWIIVQPNNSRGSLSFVMCFFWGNDGEIVTKGKEFN